MNESCKPIVTNQMSETQQKMVTLFEIEPHRGIVTGETNESSWLIVTLHGNESRKEIVTESKNEPIFQESNMQRE